MPRLGEDHRAEDDDEADDDQEDLERCGHIEGVVSPKTDVDLPGARQRLLARSRHLGPEPERVDAKVSWQMRLIVPIEQRRRFRDIGLLGEASPPPAIVVGNRMELGQEEGDQPDGSNRRLTANGHALGRRHASAPEPESVDEAVDSSARAGSEPPNQPRSDRSDVIGQRAAAAFHWLGQQGQARAYARARGRFYNDLVDVTERPTQKQSAKLRGQPHPVVSEFGDFRSTHHELRLLDAQAGLLEQFLDVAHAEEPDAVSYTHLTLPTNREV